MAIALGGLDIRHRHQPEVRQAREGGWAAGYGQPADESGRCAGIQALQRALEASALVVGHVREAHRVTVVGP